MSFSPLLRLKSSLFNTLITRSPHRLFHVTLPAFEPKLTKDIQQSITTQTHFSTKLSAHLFTNKYPNTNVVFCPISVHSNLCHIATEAKGKTLKQLLGFLKTNSKDEFNWLNAHYFNIFRPDRDNGLDIHFAFMIKILVRGYHPDVNKVTKAEFKHVYKTKGLWFEKYDLFDIKYSDFYLLDGKKVTVTFMVGKEKHLFAEYDAFKVLGFPHFVSQETHNLDYKFTVYMFLPKAKDGLGSLIEKMRSTPDFLETHIPDKKVEMGEVSIPIFHIFTEFDVSSVLKKLGLVLPFSYKEGMSDMLEATYKQNYFVSGMHHRFALSMLYRVERKSEAVSAYMGEGSNVDFVADHPFVFVIRDEVTKVVFFMGQVIDPSVKPAETTI